jgi:hypothetical protein
MNTLICKRCNYDFDSIARYVEGNTSQALATDSPVCREAIAAQVARDREGAIANMNEAIAIEDSVYALSQPPYPIIPAHELFGSMLLTLDSIWT